MNRELDISSIELMDIELYKASIDNISAKDYSSFRYEYSVDFTVFIGIDVVGVVWDVDYFIDSNKEENGSKAKESQEESESPNMVGSFVFNLLYDVDNVQDFLEQPTENQEAFISKSLYYYILDNSYNILKGLIWGLTQGTALANSFLPSNAPTDIYDYHPAALLTLSR